MLLSTAIATKPGASALDEAIRRLAPEHGVEVNHARAIAFQESGFNPNVSRGTSGEIGPFQVMPATATAIMQEGGFQADPYSIEGNALLGIYYLGSMLAQFGDKWKATGAYNAGPGRVKSGDWFAQLPASTRDYVTRVQGYYEQLQSENPDYNVPFIGAGSFGSIINQVASFFSSISQSLGIPVWAVAGLVISIILIVLAQA